MSRAEPIDDLAPREPAAERSPWKLAPRTALGVLAGSLLLITLVALATNAQPVLDPGDLGPKAAGQVRMNLLEPGHDALPELEVVDRTAPQTPPRLPGIVAIAAAVIVGLVAIAALRSIVTGNTSWWRLRGLGRGRFESRDDDSADEPAPDELADIAGQLRERLLSESDPRLAIQQAYAAVESGFGIEQLTRQPAETPLLYLDRVFGRVGSVQAPLARLTALFEVARFSTRPVTGAMRDDAAAALDEIRTIYLDKSTERQLAVECSP